MDGSISSLPPASLPLGDEPVPVVQGGATKRAPASAFGIPKIQATAPTALTQFQLWIDTSTTPRTLRMFIGSAWHPLYKINDDGSLIMTAPLTLPGNPTANSHAATKSYVDSAVLTLTNSVIIKGAIDCSGSPNYPDGNEGDLWYVSVAGKIGGSGGIAVTTDCVIVCKTNSTASGPQSTAGASWFLLSSAAQVAAMLAGYPLGGDLGGTPGAAILKKIGTVPLHNDTPMQGQGWFYDTVTSSYRARTNEGINYLVNSAFEVWQENTSYSFGGSANKLFIADFWKVAAGNPAFAASRVAAISGSQYALKIQRAAGSTSTTKVKVAQQFGTPESIFLAGRSVVVSFDLLMGANCTPNDFFANLHCGTGVEEDIDLHASPPNFATGGTTVFAGFLSQLPALGVVARMISTPIAIPAGTTELCLDISSAAYVGTAGADDSFTIANVKLEIGNIGTHYRKVDYSEELRRAQRRYFKTFLQATVPAQSAGALSGERRAIAGKAGATVQSLGTVQFPVPMRNSTWSSTTFNPAGANAQVRDFTAGADCSSTAVQNPTEQSCEIITTGNASTAVGNTLGVHLTIDNRL